MIKRIRFKRSRNNFVHSIIKLIRKNQSIKHRDNIDMKYIYEGLFEWFHTDVIMMKLVLPWKWS